MSRCPRRRCGDAHRSASLGGIHAVTPGFSPDAGFKPRAATHPPRLQQPPVGLILRQQVAGLSPTTPGHRTAARYSSSLSAHLHSSGLLDASQRRSGASDAPAGAAAVTPGPPLPGGSRPTARRGAAIRDRRVAAARRPALWTASIS